MEVGVAPGDVVLDRDSAPNTERGTAAVHFSANFGGKLLWHSHQSQQLLSRVQHLALPHAP